MKSREKATEIWKSIASHVPVLEKDFNDLDFLLDVTKNDGSMSEAQWYRLRDVRYGLRAFLTAMRGT